MADKGYGLPGGGKSDHGSAGKPAAIKSGNNTSYSEKLNPNANALKGRDSHSGGKK